MNLNIRARRCLENTIYMFDVIVVILNGLYYIAIKLLMRNLLRCLHFDKSLFLEFKEARF